MSAKQIRRCLFHPFHIRTLKAIVMVLPFKHRRHLACRYLIFIDKLLCQIRRMKTVGHLACLQHRNVHRKITVQILLDFSDRHCRGSMKIGNLRISMRSRLGTRRADDLHGASLHFLQHLLKLPLNRYDTLLPCLLLPACITGTVIFQYKLDVSCFLLLHTALLILRNTPAPHLQSPVPKVPDIPCSTAFFPLLHLS